MFLPPRAAARTLTEPVRELIEFRLLGFGYPDTNDRHCEGYRTPPGVGRGREARGGPIAANARTRGKRGPPYGVFGVPVPAQELRHPCERGLNGDIDERSRALNA